MEMGLNNVVRVYNGKPGCMCGCNGKYRTPADNARSVKIMYNKIMNNPAKVVDEVNGWVYVTNREKNQVIYFLED
jgi:hypothetical protein